MINAVMAMLLIGELCAAVLVLLSQSQMRLMADWLNARADALDWNEERFARYKEQRREREQEAMTR